MGQEFRVHVDRKQRDGGDADRVLEDGDGDDAEDQQDPAQGSAEKEVGGHGPGDENTNGRADAAALFGHLDIDAGKGKVEPVPENGDAHGLEEHVGKVRGPLLEKDDEVVENRLGHRHRHQEKEQGEEGALEGPGSEAEEKGAVEPHDDRQRGKSQGIGRARRLFRPCPQKMDPQCGPDQEEPGQIGAAFALEDFFSPQKQQHDARGRDQGDVRVGLLGEGEGGKPRDRVPEQHYAENEQQRKEQGRGRCQSPQIESWLPSTPALSLSDRFTLGLLRLRQEGPEVGGQQKSIGQRGKKLKAQLPNFSPSQLRRLFLPSW